ncbi:MAG TPA: hypothetical protein VNH44_01135 [Micropepsaceae bacterium]|nr:hypothetical protein [Micropepsaceae bacterium]
MRLIALIATLAILAAGPAAAQSWKEYEYPQYAFAVSFPAEPTVETKMYQTADGTSAEARVYSVMQPNAVFTMTVVDLSAVQTDEKAVIDHAIQTLSQAGDIKLDIPHRISAVYGRQLSIAGRDGSHSSIAVFYHQKRLYQIQGMALASGEDGTADAIRFQQSLIFTRNAANRGPLEPVFQVLGRAFFGRE